MHSVAVGDTRIDREFRHIEDMKPGFCGEDIDDFRLADFDDFDDFDDFEERADEFVWSRVKGERGIKSGAEYGSTFLLRRL